ncbi:MAG: type IV pilus secretin PilQ [Gammaproteobacteria bacterium]|nr:type IV pilus secretin PilQ family protein [Gammaproteobacteria bacterium]MBU6509811.1 type IV pilus secretin PilQ family protein [Gammaproteobacteria bacterium]MDE1983690.1 type IV pilus secretin PilQ [Gammaproteobacteria bacterium]MDE2107844.1 type IV pilus secretin PilQ [Gammaproteobacteria bacterium]MDE2460525.1 type IV pilus secretin PilQ [Gammaproteobacteria bacterium]
MKSIFGLLRMRPQPWLLAVGLLIAGFPTMHAALAQTAPQGSNQLTAVTATKLPGDRVQLQLKLNAPASKPLSFTVGQPARIALDIDDTRMALSNRETDINVGNVNSVVAAEAGTRTRVVVNLTSLVPYNVSVLGDTIYVLLGGNSSDTAVAQIDPASLNPSITAVAAAAPAPASSPAAASTPAGQTITNVDFRRGNNGMGRVIVNLSTPSIVGNVHMAGSDVVVDFANTRLPQNLVRRMDVTDFATPVQYIDAENTPTGVRLVIHPSGQYDKLAFQSDNLFAMEFTPVSAQAAQVAQQQQFSGQKISLNFQNIDIRAVLQILADASGKNIVVSDSVHGNITLRLQDVPWDQALDIIMKTKGLASRSFGNTLIIGTAQDIAAQEQAEFAAQQSLEQSSPLQSAFIQVNYAKASDIADLIKGQGKASLLSPRGSLSVDSRTNTLLVQDTAANIAAIRQMVAKLDIPVKQVLIESRIVVANNDYTTQLGVQFGANGIRQTSGGLMSLNGDLTGTNTQQNAFNPPAGGAPVTGTPLLSLPALGDQLNVNVPTGNPFGQIAFGVLRQNFLVDLELSAMAAAGKGEVVSSPRVITANAKEATIVQGIEIPYTQSASSGATTVSFKNAVLSLDVTPQITPDNRIIMDLEVHDDTVGQFVPTANGGSVPSINTRNVKTQVLVDDGDTVVLGGIYETTNTSTVNKVPLLGDIPLLGWLFRNTQKTNNKDELLIFVTPKIMTQNAMLGD